MFNCKICRPIFEHEIHPPWQLRLWSFAALESEGLAVPKRTYREVLQQVGLGLQWFLWFPIVGQVYVELYMEWLR